MTAAMNLRSALRDAMAQLSAANVPSHSLAAELLLMHTLGRDRAWIYAHPEFELDAAEAEKYFGLVARRASGVPTQYLTGKQEFWGLEFEVTPAVLIPRPETEHVIEVALARLGPRGIQIDMATGAPSPELRIADVGTGSGCLAVAFAHELPHGKITATDISAAALEVARRNAVRHFVQDRIHFVHTDLLDALIDDPLDRSRPFDLIASNPPYVARTQAGTLAREVRDHEPHAALFGGPAGPEVHSRLIEQAGRLLRPGGILVLELGYNSAGEVLKMLEVEPHWTSVSITNDLAAIPRVIAAVRS